MVHSRRFWRTGIWGTRALPCLCQERHVGVIYILFLGGSGLAMASLGSTLAFVLSATLVFIIVVIAEYCNRRRKRKLRHYENLVVQEQQDDFLYG